MVSVSGVGNLEPGAAVASARKLAELKPELLAVGHGRMIENPMRTIGEAIAETNRMH